MLMLVLTLDLGVEALGFNFFFYCLKVKNRWLHVMGGVSGRFWAAYLLLLQLSLLSLQLLRPPVDGAALLRQLLLKLLQLLFAEHGMLLDGLRGGKGAEFSRTPSGSGTPDLAGALTSHSWFSENVLLLANSMNSAKDTSLSLLVSICVGGQGCVT